MAWSWRPSRAVPRCAESARLPPRACLERPLAAGAARRRRGAEPTAALCQLPRMLHASLARMLACMRGAPISACDQEPGLGPVCGSRTGCAAWQ